MDDDQQFCLRWNNHQSTLVSVFDTLLEKGMHVDCTLAAEGQTLKAHKVVLSACSPYFESVLSQQYDKHPIIILKDVKYAELRAMMDYMYRGEVNISQDQLAALLKAAESLQIKGLSDNKPSRPPSRPAQAVAAHPPRAPSPPPQARDGSIDSSREGSVSPTRRRKKARRMSNELPPAPIPPPNDNAQGNGDDAACKEELQRDGVEDLTLDEETDEQPVVAHNDVVRNFQWHMERSQDDIMNSSDGARESQELHKDSHLPSALLSLLSVQQAQSQSLVSLVPSCIQVTNIMKPSATKDLVPYGSPLHLSKLPLDTLNSIPENIKAHLLQQAFMQNNNMPIKQDDTESDAEYDDTDDIVLPEESDTFYDSNGGFPSNSGSIHGDDVYDTKPDMKGHWKRDGNSSDDASRQFECKHCGGGGGGPEDVSFTRIGGLSWDQWSARLALPFAGMRVTAPSLPPTPGEPSFTCPDCGRVYKLKSSLRNHQKWECGKEPQFQCPYCVYRAKQKMHIARHMERMHREVHMKPEQYIKQDNVDACT